MPKLLRWILLIISFLVLVIGIWLGRMHILAFVEVPELEEAQRVGIEGNPIAITDGVGYRVRFKVPVAAAEQTLTAYQTLFEQKGWKVKPGYFIPFVKLERGQREVSLNIQYWQGVSGPGINCHDGICQGDPAWREISVSSHYIGGSDY